MRRIVLFILTLLIDFTIKGQTGPPQLVTDRPDQTESASVIPPGLVQIETGVVLERDKFTENNLRTEIQSMRLATTLLRVGITKSAELRITSEYNTEKTRSNGEEFNPQGMNGVSLGGKLHLTGEKGIIPETAILAHLELPIGHQDFRPDRVLPNFRLAMAHTLSDRFDFSYNVGREYVNGGGRVAFIYTSTLGVEISERLGGFLEIFGDVPTSTDMSVQFDAGFTYLLQSNLQIDTSTGFVVFEDSPGWFLSAGITMRLPR